MIVYFANRFMNILGHASTMLREGLTIIEDLKSESVEKGVAVFECKLPFDQKTRTQVETCTEAGNYILRSHDGENEFYTIIDTEIDSKKQQVFIYAEDAGMDLLNEIVGAYTADQAYSIRFYIEKFAYDSGFEIGINEAAGLTSRLSWDGEATAAERIASVAALFGNYEVSYSFDVKGLEVTKKYINIYKKRGKDSGVQLRLNKEIDRIVTKKSVANLATALECTGGTPENAETPITLSGYRFDDGDFHISGNRLLSREALKKWSRYVWTKEPGQIIGQVGHIVRQYTDDTLEQSTLCAHAVAKLKELREAEVNYEVDISELPESVKIGDRINIIDDAGNLYLSTRILLLETSVADQKHAATLGDYLIKNSGVSQKVEELASKFAENSLDAKRAKAIADAAKAKSEEAQNQAEAAVTEAERAKTSASEAKTSADEANKTSQAAKESADHAQAAVGTVVEEVTSLETSVLNAKTAAENAQKAATNAQLKADEAALAASNAEAEVKTASTSASAAKTAADSAVSKSETAQTTASTAKTDAAAAIATAAAAKADAAQAEKNIAALGDHLDTVSSTMRADYARKTDLTEAEATLQTQITQNAAGISSTARLVKTIDETANQAAAQAASAQTAAAAAKTTADQATTDASAAKTAADQAATAAASAQAQADTAKTAAATAKSVADKAETGLAAAKADLSTVTSRVDATQDDIVAAQAAVMAAQTAADKAKTDAAAAAEKAGNAQTTANTAVTNAASAQTAANDAASKANLAQKTADAAKGDAAAAQSKANEAAITAADAQKTANTAKTNATAAQTSADKAAATAATAQTAASDAGIKAAKAAEDLKAAQNKLADVTSRVDATEDEVAEAKEAVTTAQSAAQAAAKTAATAQNTADAAKKNAATAQTAADTAKTAADRAQTAAAEAKAAADKAQKAADALEVRVTTAETNITQNSEAIKLSATKTEVTEEIGQSSSELRETIVSQNDITVGTCEGIILQALSSYTQSGDFNSFKETMQSQLTLLSNQMTLKFTETNQQLEGMNKSLQKQLNTITKYFAFDIDGLTIGETSSPNKVVIDNDEIVIEVNGNAVQKFDASGKSLIPELKVIKALDLFGYLITEDSIGNVNCEWIGG